MFCTRVQKVDGTGYHSLTGVPLVWGPVAPGPAVLAVGTRGSLDVFFFYLSFFFFFSVYETVWYILKYFLKGPKTTNQMSFPVTGGFSVTVLTKRKRELFVFSAVDSGTRIYGMLYKHTILSKDDSCKSL